MAPFPNVEWDSIALNEVDEVAVDVVREPEPPDNPAAEVLVDDWDEAADNEDNTLDNLLDKLDDTVDNVLDVEVNDGGDDKIIGGEIDVGEDVLEASVPNVLDNWATDERYEELGTGAAAVVDDTTVAEAAAVLGATAEVG